MTDVSIEELFTRAVGLHRTGKWSEAEDLYRQLLNENPQHPGTLTNMGVLVARKGDFNEAIRFYSAAITANPAQIDAHFNLGNLHRKVNRYPEAIASYRSVLRYDPGHALGHLQLGLAYTDVGDWSAAIGHLYQSIQYDPGLADAYNILGDALYRVGRVKDAVAIFEKFVVQCPDEPRGHHNLGLALAAIGEYEKAIPELELALKLRPDYPDAHNSLGVALEAVGRADDAHSHYLEATSLRPEFADAWSNLGTSLVEQGRVHEAITALTRATDLRPDPRSGSNRLLAIAYSSEYTAAQIRDEHVDWVQRYVNPSIVGHQQNRIVPLEGRRLKIGYVSGDFRSHTAAGLIEVLLKNHDRNHFHITCYPNLTRQDETSDRLRRLSDSWRTISAMLDQQAAELIREDEIDILVDLSGHTAGNRLHLFARKPAAVQMTLFGYPCTTGLPGIDYKISDPFADPPSESGEQYVEEVLHLPETAWVYAPPEHSPMPNKLPALNHRVFTFGCLNNPAKLSDACTAAWARILKAVPSSRLVLLAGLSVGAARIFGERFTSLGVSSDRLEIVYRLPPHEYLEAYQPIDLALDPFPFNGGVTTCDALWMGVPVLSISGTDYRSRQGASILNNLGIPEFVADSVDKLVELAAIWREQRAGLADLRTSLRELMLESPITQAARYVKNLEAAYVTAMGKAVAKLS